MTTFSVVGATPPAGSSYRRASWQRNADGSLIVQMETQIRSGHGIA